MVTTEDLDVKKAHTPHARRSKENVLGITVPLQSVISKTPQNPELNEDTIGKNTDDDVHTTGGDAHMVDDDVHIPNDDVQMTEEEEDDVGVQKNNDNADVTPDVTNNTEDGPDADACINVVNLDDLSDSDLVANVNPSIAKRLMTRRGKKVVNQSPPKREVVLKSTSGPMKRKVPKSTSTGPIKSKDVSQSTPIGPVKSKVVPKSTSVGPTKSWSKVVPKKMKAQVIAESDSDVAMDYQDTPLKKKPTTSKLAASVPEVPIDSVSFHYPSSANRWKYVYQKRLALERELVQNTLKCKEIKDLINEVGLIKIVTHFSKCYEMLVKEFIVNLLEDCADRKSKDFRKVYVRGKCVTFSSTIINNYLGRSDEAQPELEVSDNKVCEVITTEQVKSWPLKGKFFASKLNIKYAMLHKIGDANWLPTNHKSIVATILGKFIYAVGTKTRFDYGIILNQYPNILNENDSVCKRESTMSFHYKLFQGTHVPDIVMTSAETSKGTSKKICKELDARKVALEKMISTLEMDENDTFVDAAETEGQAEQENGSDSDDEKEEEEVSLADGTNKEIDDDSSSGSESDD
ncbi:uncharacterized protein LOC131626010 [Vicia villosa]|uniref:uncharacterized protein LOC131626010 n=1 Tax=Vicia villosa TaxID=3911 RepID=UPI00273B7AA0|nr:uncharacterized protein LOC131626010 [Vicia villosa]